MRTYTDAYARLFILLSTAQLALCSGDTQAAASVDICAGAYRRMEYKPGLIECGHVTSFSIISSISFVIQFTKFYKLMINLAKITCVLILIFIFQVELDPIYSTLDGLKSFLYCRQWVSTSPAASGWPWCRSVLTSSATRWHVRAGTRLNSG